MAQRQSSAARHSGKGWLRQAVCSMVKMRLIVFLASSPGPQCLFHKTIQRQLGPKRAEPPASFISTRSAIAGSRTASSMPRSAVSSEQRSQLSRAKLQRHHHQVADAQRHLGWLRGGQTQQPGGHLVKDVLGLMVRQLMRQHRHQKNRSSSRGRWSRRRRAHRHRL